MGLLTGWSLVGIRPGEPSPNSNFDLSWFSPFSVKPRDGFDTGCSRFHLLHGRRREALPINCAGVADNLFETGVSGDRRDLVRRATCLRQADRCCLAQAMERAVVKVRYVALLAEPVAETGNGERLAELRDQKCQVTARSGINDRAQRGVNGNS
jgi:hypothetical protein